MKANGYVQSNQKGNLQNVSFGRAGRGKPRSLRHRRYDLRFCSLILGFDRTGKQPGVEASWSPVGWGSLARYGEGLSGPAASPQQMEDSLPPPADSGQLGLRSHTALLQPSTEWQISCLASARHSCSRGEASSYLAVLVRAIASLKFI